MPELKKGVLVDTNLLIILGEIFAHKIKGKNIVPGRDRVWVVKTAVPFTWFMAAVKSHARLPPVP